VRTAVVLGSIHCGYAAMTAATNQGGNREDCSLQTVTGTNLLTRFSVVACCVDVFFKMKIASHSKVNKQKYDFNKLVAPDKQ
jgi:hypothetical protein